MILMIIMLALSAVVWRFVKRSSTLKKYELVPVVVMVIAIVALISGAVEDKVIQSGNVIKKNENGDGEREISLYIDSPNVLDEEEYEIVLPERELTEEEAYTFLEKARYEVAATLPGENESLEKVTQSLNLRTKFCDGKVKASYEIDPAGIIDEEGAIIWSNVPNNTEITINIALECRDIEVAEKYMATVFRDGLSDAQKLKQSLENYFHYQYEANAESPDVELPTEINGYAIKWEEHTRVPYKLIFVFMIVIAAMLVYLKYKEGGKKDEKRLQDLKEQYPDMIDQLTLLIAAGMNTQGAWARMVSRYQGDLAGGSAEMAVYDEMSITLQEIRDGVSEAAAYERFASRTGLQCYRRFSGLLIQNLKKGGAGMLGQLEHEVTEAFDEKKREARRVGEEAGTKLLMPMILMLGVVLVVLMAPVLMDM